MKYSEVPAFGLPYEYEKIFQTPSFVLVGIIPSKCAQVRSPGLALPASRWRGAMASGQ